jgi:hypothetical protein
MKITFNQLKRILTESFSESIETDDEYKEFMVQIVSDESDDIYTEGYYDTMEEAKKACRHSVNEYVYSLEEGSGIPSRLIYVSYDSNKLNGAFAEVAVQNYPKYDRTWYIDEVVDESLLTNSKNKKKKRKIKQARFFPPMIAPFPPKPPKGGPGPIPPPGSGPKPPLLGPMPSGQGPTAGGAN